MNLILMATSNLVLPSNTNNPAGYEYVELNVDSATAFTTAVQGRSSKDTPQFYIGNGFSGIAGIKIIEAVVPISWYNIDNRVVEIATGDPQGTLFFGVDFLSGPNYAISKWVIPSGTYSSTQLAAYLTTFLNSSDFYNIVTTLGLVQGIPPNSVTYDPITSTFSWVIYVETPGVDYITNFYMNPYGGGDDDYGGIYLNSMLGFKNGISGGNPFNVQMPDPQAFTLTFTSGYAVSSGPNYITVNSKILGPLLKCVPNQDTSSGVNAFGYSPIGMTTSHLANIPLSENNGQVQVWQDCGQAQVYETPYLSGIQRFDLYLTLGPYETPIYLNGLSFQIKFKFLLEVSVSPLTASNSGIV